VLLMAMRDGNGEGRNAVGKTGGGRTKTRDLAFAGIITAFTVLALYFESIIPTGRAGFLVLTSFLLCAVYLESGMKWLMAAYAASSALSLLLVADKLGLLPFLLLFGIYPALKNLVERLRSVWLEWLLKLAGFNILLMAGYAVFNPLLPEALTTGKWAALSLAVFEIGFVLYDMLFTQWIHFYLARIAPRFRRSPR
jgi:hypothetical protein